MGHSQQHVYTCDACDEIKYTDPGEFPGGWFRIGEVTRDPKRRPRKIRHVCSQACAKALIEKETGEV